MRKVALILPFLLLLGSCRMILLKMYGIKNPDIENEKSIRKKALHYKLDTSNIVTVNSKDFLRTFREADGIPNAQLFDAAGNYIEYRQSDTSCNAGLFQFIPDLAPTKVYNLTNKTQLLIEYQKYRSLKGANLKDLPKADFYLFIYWTVWTGKLNKDHVKVWEDLARQNTKAKICVVKVNLDIQEYWDKAERDAVIAKLGKK